MNRKRQKKSVWRRGYVRRNMQRVLASILCIVLVFSGIYVPGMTVRAAETKDLSSEDSSSWDASDISGEDDIADNTALQLVLFNSEEGDIASGTYENVTWVIDADGKLTVEGTGEFSEAEGYYRAPWYDQRDNIKAAVIRITGLKDASYMFYGCKRLTSLDLSSFDTRNVTDMEGMFSVCNSLTSLDLSSLDTHNVTNMEGMFTGSSSLTSLDLSSFDMRNVTDMSSMFWRCNSLTSLDLSSFDKCNVTDMSHMFDGCSSLTSLDLSSFDTHNVTDMSHMFDGCSSLTSLDLSSFDTSNVTDMSHVFYDCQKLTSLDLSSFNTSNVTAMDYMFYDCYSLASLDLSSFDTRNVKYREYMFSFCRSLTSLDLSSFDMGKVMNTIQMFEGCSRLTLINTPYNLKKSISLPSGTWYRSDGSIVKYLPTDLSYSVVLQKDAIPVEKSHFMPDITVLPDTSMLLIMEAPSSSNKNVKPLSGAKVTVGNGGSSYTTDNTGTVAVNEEGTQTITVEKEGYTSAKVTKDLVSGKLALIYLYSLSAEQKTQVLSATMNLTGEEQDIFNGSKSLTLIHKDLSKVTGGEDRDFVITVNAAGSPEKYQLLQNGKIIQESTTGVFTLKGKQVQEKDNTYSNYVEDLEAGYKISVRVFDTDGKFTKHDLGIRVSEASSASWKWPWDDNEAGIELGDKLSISVPNSVPLYGGTDINLGLEEALPVEVKIDDTGKVRIAVNMGKFDTNDSAAWAEQKNTYDNLSKWAVEAYNDARTFGETPQSYGAGMFSVKGSVMGYGEGYLDEKTNSVCVSVGMILQIEGEAEYTQYFFVAFVPFYVTFGGGVSLTASGKLDFSISDRFLNNGGTLEIEPAIYAKLKGGIGADGILSLSASGKVTLAWLHRFTPDYDRVSLNGNAKITGEVLFWDKDFLELDGTWVIYDSNEQSAPALLSRNSIANPDMSDAKIISMDYLDKRAAYSAQAGGVMTYSLTNAKESASTRVLDYAYRNASPRLLRLGDKLYLFYLDGVEGRSDQNQTALFYQISSDHGATWSEASRADNGANETADFHFDIATDGTDIYVVWSDAGDVYGEDFLAMDTTAAMTKLGKEMDLMLAVIDGSTGDVRSTSVLKTEAGDLQPQIYAGNDGAVTVAWITNDCSAADGLISNANRMGICYASSTSDYQVQTLSLEDGKYPQKLAVGLLGTQVCIAAGLDTDGDLSTQDDRDIYIAYPAASGKLSAITANEFVDSVPLFGRVGGQDCLFWYQENNIAYTPDGQTTHLVFAEEEQNSSGQDFSLLESSVDDGKAAVVWTATSLTEENGVDIYCADFDGQTWSAPYRLGALDSEYTTHLDGWMDDTGYHLTYLGKEYTDDTLKAHICLDAPKELIDTAVTWYPEAEEHPGKSYPLQLVVMNNGNQTVKSLQISSKDGSIQDVITGLSIAPGTSEEVTWSGITLPEEMTELYTQELTVLADGEANAEDNAISLALGAPDFSIDVYSDFANGELYAGVIVINRGILSSNAVIKIYRDSAHEQEIFSTGIRDIAGGESKTTLLDMAKLHEITPAFYFTVSDSMGMEIYTGDNEAFLYEGKGLWLEYDDGQGAEQPGVSVLQAEKTKTVYEYGDTLNVDDLTVTLLGSDGTATETVTNYSTNADSIDMLTLGEKTLTVTYGEYSASVTLTVEPCTLKEANTVVTLPYTSCVYDGTAKEPLPKSVTVNGVELVNETDYTVSWSDNIAIGDATITVTGQGNYRGTLSFSFAITKEAVEEEGLYTVTFDLNGHGTLAPLTGVKQGSLIDEPQSPKAQGYRFTGWYQDKECTVLWHFDTDVVQENLTLYAGWRIVMGGGDGSGESSGDQDEELSIQEIRSQTYTGNALKPTVCVYFGDDSTPLKAGKDYTIKYYNNIDADTDAETGMGGISSTGEEVKQGFTKQLAYVVITGKGNYKGTVYQNFHIVPASIVNKEGDDPAAGFTLKYTDQLVTNSKKAQKPFTSLKYKKALKAGKDYEVILTAVTAYDGAEKQLAGGSVVARSTGTGALPAIPAGYHGSFTMRVNGIGNFTGSFEKAIYVTDKSHLLKNVSITLGKNQKKTDYTGQNIILRPGYYDASAKTYYAVGEDGTISTQAEPGGDNVFTVKIGKEYLLYGRDYTVSYGNHRNVGTATMIFTGKGDYTGSKSVTFQIKGSAFNAKTIRVDGMQAALAYNGKALTQSGVKLTEISTAKALVYAKDYTVTYKNNLKKGTATMIFTAKPSSGYSGSFQKNFRITAAPLTDTVKVTAVNTAQDQIVYEGTKIRLDGTVAYTREGAKPSGRIQLCNNTTGEMLKEGTDYTVTYQNNTTVTAVGANQAVMLLKGKNNYTGTLQVDFRISAASLTEQPGLKATATPIAFNAIKAVDYEYRPAMKLTDGRKPLRAGTDYEVTYVNCTQKAVTAYLMTLSNPILAGQSYEQMRPYARIEAKEGSGYQGSMIVDLTIYNTKITASNLYVVITPDLRQTTYSGRQVTPEVTVYYGEKQAVKAAKQAGETSDAVLTNASGSYKLTKLTLKTDGTAGDYTLLYGTNTIAGKNKGSITINGTGLYGGKVTVKFTINQRDVYSQSSPK